MQDNYDCSKMRALEKQRMQAQISRAPPLPVGAETCVSSAKAVRRNQPARTGDRNGASGSPLLLTTIWALSNMTVQHAHQNCKYANLGFRMAKMRWMWLRWDLFSPRQKQQIQTVLLAETGSQGQRLTSYEPLGKLPASGATVNIMHQPKH